MHMSGNNEIKESCRMSQICPGCGHERHKGKCHRKHIELLRALLSPISECECEYWDARWEETK
jgi:hypothetical protein